MFSRLYMARKYKYINLTKEIVKNMFEECNKLYFNGEVECPTRLETWTPGKRILGLTRPCVNKRTGKVHAILHISNRYNWTNETLRHVVVHEMIHMLIKDYQRPLRWWERILPFLIKQHDDEFIDKMNELNEEYGLDIKVRFREMRAEFKG